MRKVILYISMSLDGYIARVDGDISFLSLMEQKDQDYGYADFNKTVDTVIVGRKSYDKVVSMGFKYPHNDKDVFIISKTRHENSGSFKYYSGSLKTLVSGLKSKPGKNIYCDGGSLIVNELLKENLIDEFIISVIPIILGDGIELFTRGRPEISLRLINCEKFETGLVQIHYEKVI
jgi:dihydrofolate reductase